ncbi:MAG TPA: carbohydrate kinase family protein [Anaerolineales bacterium]|nr:carbohydrate kinase family protein [Anaerolineales bacterium]
MDVVITGSIAFDYLMRFPGRFVDHILPEKLTSISLSFLVDSMVRQRGGIAPNIAYSYALLGGRARLFSTVGEDFEEYRVWLENRGVDTSLVRTIPGINSASFFANIDQDNNQIASFYPGAMSYAAELSFHDLDGKTPDLVVISPTDPAAMRAHVQECQDLFIPYIYDPSQQLVRLPPEDIRRGVEGARALFVNEYEFSLIEKHTGLDRAAILDHVEILVVTLANQGAQIYSGDQGWQVPAFPTDLIKDPTGVGDAFRGGFLTGLRMGWDYELCGMLGSLSATYCLEAVGPQGQSYTIEEYITRFREYFDDEGRLDALLA